MKNPIFVKRPNSEVAFYSEDYNSRFGYKIYSKDLSESTDFGSWEEIDSSDPLITPEDRENFEFLKEQLEDRATEEAREETREEAIKEFYSIPN